MKQIAAAALVLSLLARPASADDTVWKIGALLCVTGPCASDGTAAMRGMQLAAEDLNSSGGVLGKRISVKLEDGPDAIGGARTITAYQALRADKEIHFFVGPTWTPGGLALAPIVSKDPDIIITSPSLGAADFHKAGRNIFNSRGVDESATRSVARFIKTRGLSRAAVIYSDQPWEEMQGKFFVDEFKKSGGTVVKEVPLAVTDAEVLNGAAAAMTAKPDVIYSSNVVQAASVLKALDQLQYRGPKYFAYLDPQRVSEAGGRLVEGIIVANIGAPTEAFQKRYEEQFKEPIAYPAAVGYDTVKAYAAAVERAKSFDVQKVIPEYEKTNMFGVSGPFTFDAEGCAQREIKFMQMRGGKLEPLENPGG